MVRSLSEFVLCDVALSLGRSQRQSLNMLFAGNRRIEHRTSRDVLFQCLQGSLDRKLACI